MEEPVMIVQVSRLLTAEVATNIKEQRTLLEPFTTSETIQEKHMAQVEKHRLTQWTTAAG